MLLIQIFIPHFHLIRIYYASLPLCISYFQKICFISYFFFFIANITSTSLFFSQDLLKCEPILFSSHVLFFSIIMPWSEVLYFTLLCWTIFSPNKSKSFLSTMCSLRIVPTTSSLFCKFLGLLKGNKILLLKHSPWKKVIHFSWAFLSCFC